MAAFTPPPAPTKTPPPTLAPTLVSGEIAKLYDDKSQLEVILDDKRLIVAPPNQNRHVIVNHANTPNSGLLAMIGGSQLQFNAVTNSKIQLRLLPSSDLFAQTDPYQNGIEIELARLSVVISAKGCLGVHYADDSHLSADCFDGVCGFSINFGAQTIAFESGQQIQLDVSQLRLVALREIPATDIIKYRTLLSATNAGRQSILPASSPAKTDTHARSDNRQSNCRAYSDAHANIRICQASATPTP